MKRKYTRYTKELLEPIVNTSISYRECLIKLGLKPTGGNYSNLQRNIDKFKLNTNHMKHQAANSGKEFKTFEELTTNNSIKKRLINIHGHKCSICNLSEWLGSDISLELDHIDGDNRNNSVDNVRVLCPNCHSQTPTYRNNKR